MSSAYQTLTSVAHPFAQGSAASVFPRYSAQVVKETVAVISLALVAAALVTATTLLAPDLFSRAASSVACSTLDLWSLLGPWCSALI
jgi:hypothetical protein